MKSLNLTRKLRQLIFLGLLLLAACTTQKEEKATVAPDSLVEAKPIQRGSFGIPYPTDSLLVEYAEFLIALDEGDPYSVRTAIDKFHELFRDKQKVFNDTAFYWFENFYALATDQLNEMHGLHPGMYDDLVMDSTEVTLSPNLRAYRDSLQANGFVIDMTEGVTYVAQNRNFMIDAFYPHLSPVMVEYLKQENLENEEGFQEDAGLVIGPETLGSRLAWWEAFNQANPDFLFQNARANEQLYLGVLMTGMDNTPLYFGESEEEKPKLDEYYVTAYTHLFTNYPYSKLSKRLRPYYELLLAHDADKAEAFRDSFND